MVDNWVDIGRTMEGGRTGGAEARSQQRDRHDRCRATGATDPPMAEEAS
jgi:hypothetical protein